ncbi:hypothetical protein EV666_101591 [Camelimonas lactis]|uniref:Uncharacterized protein n=1 Tax=Camelimonas lactis TaxID=659006 RepID=A0A4R2GZV8_9HYPH|nr:hypothetical protein EV666_101591 [Camelimonas lactis]
MESVAGFAPVITAIRVAVVFHRPGSPRAREDRNARPVPLKRRTCNGSPPEPFQF